MLMAGLGRLFSPTVQQLIREKRWDALRDYLLTLDPADVADILVEVPDQDDAAIFRLLPRLAAARVFAYFPHHHQHLLPPPPTPPHIPSLLAVTPPATH